METYEMMLRRRAREAAKMEKIKSALCETLGALAIISLMGMFGLLCCAASGYHWE